MAVTAFILGFKKNAEVTLQEYVARPCSVLNLYLKNHFPLSKCHRSPLPPHTLMGCRILLSSFVQPLPQKRSHSQIPLYRSIVHPLWVRLRRARQSKQRIRFDAHLQCRSACGDLSAFQYPPRRPHPRARRNEHCHRHLLDSYGCRLLPTGHGSDQRMAGNVEELERTKEGKEAAKECRSTAIARYSGFENRTWWSCIPKERPDAPGLYVYSPRSIEGDQR